MFQLIFILPILLSFNFSWGFVVCSAYPPPTSRLIQIVNRTCAETFQSFACQSLYKKISENGAKGQDKLLKCEESESTSRSFETSWSYATGCAMGGWNFIQDTFMSAGTMIGEGAAKIVLDAEAEIAANLICDKDIQLKKALFKQFNISLPKLFQIEVPPDQVLSKAPCAAVRNSLKLQIHTTAQRESLRVMQKVSQGRSLTELEKEVVSWNQAKFEALSSKSGINLVETAKASLREVGIKLECYNPKAAAAMICEAVAEITTLIGGPGAAALRAAKLKNISKISGVALNEQKILAAEKVALSADDLNAAAKLTSTQRHLAAESLLGRVLTNSEKKSLLDAHEVASGTGRGYGTYSASDLTEKARILKEAGFDLQERELLMRQGIAGSLPDTRAAQNFATATRLEAEKLRASGDIAGSVGKFRNASDSYEVYIKDFSAPKSSRDYWVGAKLNAAAEKYDKAADYFIKSERGAKRNEERIQNIFEALKREKDELRIIATKNPSSKSAQKGYQDHQKLIEAIVQSPQIQLGDAWKRELLKP